MNLLDALGAPSVLWVHLCDVHTLLAYTLFRPTYKMPQRD